MAIHCSCALLGNSLALMTTIFKVIQSYIRLLPQCFTQMAGAYRGVLVCSVSVLKASGWEHGTSCAVLNSEICSRHGCLSLCTANGWSSRKQPACATLVSATGVVRATGKAATAPYCEHYSCGYLCSDPGKSWRVLQPAPEHHPAQGVPHLLQHILLGEDSRSHRANSTTQKQGSPGLPKGFVSWDDMLCPCICYSQRSVTMSTAI